ncbi:hypothetical protein ECB94_04085 [Vibrio mediterranei]|uniref:Uncharacterized protein n=1 Tax=Vibrio mediterranei TaxID=689 RepID=A0A3G4VAB8_9VIBR|nr:hypothetical protein ECB94_04085 [Vibrio mediterranei]
MKWCTLLSTTLNKFGHDTHIISAKYVTPYRTKVKSGLNDAVVIREAAQRPAARINPIQSPEQQAVLSVDRMREHWVHKRTASMNRAIAALAAKNVRIIWSLLQNQTEYENYAD